MYLVAHVLRYFGAKNTLFPRVYLRVFVEKDVTVRRSADLLGSTNAYILET